MPIDTVTVPKSLERKLAYWLKGISSPEKNVSVYLEANERQAVIDALLFTARESLPPSSDPEGGARGEYSSLQEANIARQKEWDPDNRITLAYRGNELAGEVGEACNVIKKLERERLGINGSRDTVEHLLEELADSVICSYLVAMHVGGDLEAAIVAKFNATSEKMNLKTRLRLTKSDGSACGNYSQASQRHNSDLQPGPSDQLTKTPSADHDDGNLRGLAEPNHQPHAVSQGWQDIETAPKTRMITYHNGKTTDAVIGYCRWSVFPEDDYEAWWDYERDVEACPRFWMEVIPLPAPPSPAKTGGAE